MTWAAQPAWLWLSVEAHLAVICASASALNIFFKHTLKDYTSGSRRSRKPSGYDRSPESGQSGYVGSCRRNVNSQGAVYGGRRSRYEDSADKDFGSYFEKGFGARDEKRKLWEIRVESEIELVFTVGKVGSRDDEFQFRGSEENSI
jgi:hypothetical protein